MKRITYLLMLMLLLATFASCDKVYINGNLDGMWRLDNVQYSDSTVQPERVFYSFQRHLVQVGKYYDEEFPVRFLGNLHYSGNTMSVSNFHSFPMELYPATVEMLRDFHLYSDSTTFTIVTLNKDKLIMSNEERIYSLTKW
ncbi:MAG: lipocalin-like domain-containing protein [Bacteroidaceae bacterium]|nr:lipocalin-like domain-containing protein [Bacteroidaceae bacterium]